MPDQQGYNSGGSGRFDNRNNANTVTRTPPQNEPIPNDFIRQDMTKILEAARKIGVNLQSNNVQTNQLRNFYEAVVQIGIELDEKRQKQKVIAAPDPLVDRAKLLPTKLIWAAAKQDGERGRLALNNFYEYVRVAVESQTGSIFDNGGLDIDLYDRFRQFVEAVIIYHKAKSSRVI